MKKYLHILLALTIALTMAACAGTPTISSPAESVSTSSAGEPSPEPDEKIQLTIFTEQMQENIDQDSRVKALYDSVDKFMADNPNVEISVDALSSEPYNDKVKILAAGDELPDIFEMLGSWNKGFVESGVVMDLTDIINDDPAWKEIIKPTATGNFIIDGKTYGICMEDGGSTTLLFYNQAILEECGVSAPPKTMTELLDSFDKIRAKGYTPISLGNKGPWVGQSCYLSAIGSRFTGNDWNASIVNYSGAKFTDPEFIQGLAMMQEMADRGAFNEDMNSIDYQQQRVPYFEGKAAMFIEGHWAINSLVADCPEDVLAVTHIAGIPAIENAKVSDYTAGGNGGWAYALSSKLDGAAKDAAIGWLKTFISKESASTVLAGGNSCAIVPGDYDKSGISPLHQEFFAFLETVPFCDTYDLIFDPGVVDVMSKGIQELMINTITPEELARNIQEEYEKTAE